MAEIKRISRLLEKQVIFTTVKAVSFWQAKRINLISIVIYLFNTPCIGELLHQFEYLALNQGVIPIFVINSKKNS